MTPKSLLRLAQASSRLEDLRVDGGNRSSTTPGQRSAREIFRGWSSAAARSITSFWPKRKSGRSAAGHRADRAALFLPLARGAGVSRALPEPERAGVGPGGAAQHGRLVLPRASARRAGAGGNEGELRGSSGAREPGRRVPRGTHCGAGSDYPDGRWDRTVLADSRDR